MELLLLIKTIWEFVLDSSLGWVSSVIPLEFPVLLPGCKTLSGDCQHCKPYVKA